jgi:hypothetical protein
MSIFPRRAQAPALMQAEIHEELIETMVLSGFLEGRSLRSLRVRHNLTDDDIYIHLQQYFSSTG